MAGSITNAPGFDIATLDTQAFTSGILAPISLTVAQFYWDRNDYPKWLLANLFISKVEVERDCKTPVPIKAVIDPSLSDPLLDMRPPCSRPQFEVLENDPDDPVRQFHFEQFIHEWMAPTRPEPELQAFFHSYPKEEDQGPVFAADKVRLQDIVNLGGKATTSSGLNLKLKTLKAGGYQLINSSQAIAICPPRHLLLGGSKVPKDTRGVVTNMSVENGAGAQILTNSVSAGTASFEKQLACKCLDSLEAEICEKHAEERAADIRKPKPPRITIYQRSVLQMFGYLGATIRHPDKIRCQVQGPDGRYLPGNPIGFYVHPGVPPADNAVALEYRDVPYFVMLSAPGDGLTDPCGNYSSADYTTKVMALINELVNLSKNATELPATKTVVVQP